jgi:hypothetical protein
MKYAGMPMGMASLFWMPSKNRAATKRKEAAKTV